MPTPSPSLAREFYDSIVTAADPVAAIRSLINSDPPTFESDVFDCKLEPIEPKERDGKHKQLWSEVLGGYANAGGGVVIWGLDASKKREIDGRQIDSVCAEKPIHNPFAVESRLRELQRQATDPPLAGVEMKSYTLPEDPARGFIICYVPEGSHKPYRSEHAHKQYYLRLGDNTQVMGRSVLASMFYPRFTPAFRIAVTETIRAQKLDGRFCLAVKTISLDLLNDGTASAKDLAVWVSPSTKGTPAGPQLRTSNRWVSRDMGTRWELTTTGFPIHPGQRLPLCEVILTCKFDVSNGLWANFEPLCLDITVYCENQDRRVFELDFDGPDTMSDDKPNQWESDPVE